MAQATYVVQKGDSLASIAGKIYGDQRMFSVLSQANGGAFNLKPGDVLVLPQQVKNPFVPDLLAAKSGMATSSQLAAGANGKNFTEEQSKANQAAFDAFYRGQTKTLDVAISQQWKDANAISANPEIPKDNAASANGPLGVPFATQSGGVNVMGRKGTSARLLEQGPQTSSTQKPTGFARSASELEGTKVPIREYSKAGRAIKAPTGAFQYVDAQGKLIPPQNNAQANQQGRPVRYNQAGVIQRDAKGNIIPPQNAQQSNLQGRPVAGPKNGQAVLDAAAAGQYSNTVAVQGLSQALSFEGGLPANYQGIKTNDAFTYMSMLLGRPLSIAETDEALRGLGLVPDKTGNAYVMPNQIDSNGELLGNIFPDIVGTPQPLPDTIDQMNMPSRNWLDYMPPLPDIITYADGYGYGSNNGGGVSNTGNFGTASYIAMALRAAGG